MGLPEAVGFPDAARGVEDDNRLKVIGQRTGLMN
jgi:hypothetical protein